MYMSIHSKLLDLLQTRSNLVSDWFNDQYTKVTPLFYTSVDIRDSGYKIAPVDTNVFPAGFNNISPSLYEKIANDMNEFLKKYPQNKKVLIIQENIDRNIFYDENIKVIKHLLEINQKEVALARLDQHSLTLNADNFLITNDNFRPDLILLNSDLTEGYPQIIQNCVQPIIPNPKLGWFARTKSSHFRQYQKILEQFCQEFSLDSFFMSARFTCCNDVDFFNKDSLLPLAAATDSLIAELSMIYKRYDIPETPIVFIKADKGTYGMGITTASNGEEIRNMGRNVRKKMHRIKSGIQNQDLLLQEGIKTIVQYQSHVAEYLVYMVNGNIADTILRFNDSKGPFDNLNRHGAGFISTTDQNIDLELKQKLPCYKLIAQLATLAASSELVL